MASKCYKILLWKAYLDKGWGLTSYIKYAIALFGVASLNAKATLILGCFYMFFCLILGKLWYYFRIIDVENEIANLFNPFAREVRGKLKIRKNKKFKYSDNVI